MSQLMNYIKLKDKEIPLIIRSYKNSKSIKAYFKGNILYISKPKYVSDKKAIQIIEENEDKIYSDYIKLLELPNTTSVKQWKTGERILYRGVEFDILRERINSNKIEIKIDVEARKLVILLPFDLNDEDVIKRSVDKGIKKIFKHNTLVYLQERLPYLSKKLKIEYNSVKVQDAISRFGSCVPSKKALYFSSRIIMLSEEIIDAIIVHELCHIIYTNHSKKFYDLVKEYIPDYDRKDKWLKQNSKKILF